MRPLIGIPPCLDVRGRWRSGRDYHYIDTAYARALAEAGALPLYLPGEADPVEICARLDGLLIPGGDDFPPDRSYPPNVAFDPAPAEQRRSDQALLAAALERDLPLLGICYGMQLLALHCGGSLHHDIATDQPRAEAHQLEPGARHAIRLTPGSQLAELLGEGVEVNSRHHQAVADAGEARVVARSEDGICEAIELAPPGFALGVQWHPETMEEPHRERLFSHFVARCAEHAGQRGRSGA